MCPTLGAVKKNVSINIDLSVAPEGPEDLVATAASDTEIGLTWTDTADNEEGFKVERKTGSGVYAVVAVLGSNVGNYKDTSLAASTEYDYRVLAYNTAGNSMNSNEANAITQAPPVSVPAAPSSLGAAAVSDTQINLTWADNSTTEDGFKVERKTNVGGTYALMRASVFRGVTPSTVPRRTILRLTIMPTTLIRMWEAPIA